MARLLTMNYGIHPRTRRGVAFETRRGGARSASVEVESFVRAVGRARPERDGHGQRTSSEERNDECWRLWPSLSSSVKQMGNMEGWGGVEERDAEGIIGPGTCHTASNWHSS